MSHGRFARLGVLAGVAALTGGGCVRPDGEPNGAPTRELQGDFSVIAPPAGAIPNVEAVDRSTALNVLLVTVDTLRADHLHCYGYERPTSPRMDALAAKGTLFEHCYVQWPKTGPSMASMLSSTYGSTSGVARKTLEFKIPMHYELAPELFRAAGFETFATVANLSLSPKFQYDQGFERFHVHPGAESTGDKVTDKAIELFGERVDPGRPFFAWVHYLDPHAPYQQGREHLASFRQDDLFKRTAGAVLPVDPKALDPSAESPPTNDIGMVPAYAYLNFATELRDYVAAYDADIRFLDDQLGRLLDWMTSRGLLERTVVVVTADHGEGLGGHDYYFEHGRLPYDDCARVPLIVVHPHWPARRVAEPVALMDLAPTLLDDAGLRPGWQFEGQSLLPWLAAGAPNESARPVYVESGYAKKFDVSIRRGRWKLICFGEKFVADLVGASRYELYDIVADPLETRNLADDEPEVRAELQELLDAHAAEAWSKRPPDPSGVALTAEEIAEMERLGYVGDGGDGDGGDGVGDEPAAERTGGAQR